MKPKIRFNGFEEEWKTLPLNSFAHKRTDKNIGIKCNTTLTNSAEYGVINQLNFFDHDIANKENIGGYYIIENDDFVYNPRISVTAPVGPINRNLLGYSGIMSPLYLIFSVEGINKDFISYFFKTKLWHRHMKLYGNSGARFDRLAISDTDFFDMPISLPQYDAEQQKIALWFSHLDALIRSSEGRVAALRQVKAASLQAMFPQEGETTPQLRFNGYDGEWKKVKAETIFKTTNERNHAELPVLSATQDKGMVTRESIGYTIFHDKSTEATYKRILPGQFAIHLRSFQGGFAHSAVEGICSPAYTIMAFKDADSQNDVFWKYIFTSKSFIKRLELITYGIRDGRSISFEEFKDMDFLVPTVSEQQRIASYFTALDHRIAFETERVEKLRQVKAACLSGMFA